MNCSDSFTLKPLKVIILQITLHTVTLVSLFFNTCKLFIISSFTFCEYSNNLLKYLYEKDDPDEPPAKNRNVFLPLSALYLFLIFEILRAFC